MLIDSCSTLKLPVYMDYQASTPVIQPVMDAMLPYFTDKFGNPHASACKFSNDAAQAVEDARLHVASVINASPHEIIFTSGATESNNIAIQGVAQYYSRNYARNHIVTTSIEHKAVLNVCEALSKNFGCTVSVLPVDENGLISPEDLCTAITEKTAIVSIMIVNNEIGTIQDVETICKICKERNVFLHMDAAQAFGKIPIDVQKNKIDLLSISGHKIYGPKGIGALYLRKQSKIRMYSIYQGGGQERGLRVGTLATPLIVGLGVASKEAVREMHNDYAHISTLAHRLVSGLDCIPEIRYNAMPTDHCVTIASAKHFPGCVNVCFAGVEGEALLESIAPYVCASSGSACNSDSIEASHVLRAIALPKHLLNTAIRFGIGKMTTIEEIDLVVRIMKKSVKKLRAISPVWDMLKAGQDPDNIEEG